MKNLLGFLTSAVVVFTFAFSTNAIGWNLRTHGSMCTASGKDAVDSDWSMSNGTTSGTVLTCPVWDSSSRPKSGISALNLHGYDRNNNTTYGAVIAATCIGYFNIAGGQCGAQVSTSHTGTGAYTLSPARTYWTTANAGHFGYIYVYLPAQDTAGKSNITGYYIAD